MSLEQWLDWVPVDDSSGELAARAYRELAAGSEWDGAYDACLEVVASTGRVSELRQARDLIAEAGLPLGPEGCADAVYAAVVARLASSSPQAAVLAEPLKRARKQTQ